MRRFFIDPSDIQDNKGLITGEEAHHIMNVLRLKSGDEIELNDGAGNIYQAEIISSGKNQVSVLINNFQKIKDEPPFLHLAVALLTGKKMDLVFQKSTELGTKSIQPFTSKFNTSKDISRNKSQRWQKISAEACKQCGRSITPEIKPLSTFDDIIIRTKDYDLRLIFYESEKKKGLKEIEKKIYDQTPESVIIMIGPEGGFSNEEIEKAIQEGFVAVGLGPLILRAETAALSAVTLLQYLLGKLDPENN